MTLRVRHVDGPRVPVTVVAGFVSDEVVRHLGRTLRDGSAFDAADVLVLDLSQVADLSTESLELLDQASHVWDHDRRWLAVSGVASARSADALAGHRYLSPRGAVAAAQRFFRIAAGYTSRRDHLRAIAGAGVGVAEGVVLAALSTAARVAGRLSGLAGRH